MNRELIMTALVTQISSAIMFKTIIRRMKLWSDIATVDKPALFIRERSEIYTRASEAVPESVTLEVELHIFIDTGNDPNTIPATTMNQLIDAIDSALKPNVVTGLLTLGGVVSHCWIEGKLNKTSGDLEGDGMVIIPIKIVVPR